MRDFAALERIRSGRLPAHTALQQAQAQALTSLGDRPLIVVTAGSEPPPGWLTAQDLMAGLSANCAHRVVAAATHNSLISGVDAAASSQAILDVLACIRAGTPIQ